LGLLLLHKRDYDGSRTLFTQTLAVRRRVLGPDHPDTVSSINNLALLLSSVGDYAEAEPLYREALAVSERVLGPEHPTTLICINNLGLLLSNKGDLKGAEPLYRQTLAIRERILGQNHLSTLCSVNNLAFLLQAKGDPLSAEPLFRRTLEGLLAISVSNGQLHPEIPRCLNGLAACLESLGKQPEVIRETIESIAARYGMSFGGGRAKAKTPPPNKPWWKRW
jgi:tetratricopeptide (TPR) repeat protein